MLYRQKIWRSLVSVVSSSTACRHKKRAVAWISWNTLRWCSSECKWDHRAKGSPHKLRWICCFQMDKEYWLSEACVLALVCLGHVQLVLAHLVLVHLAHLVLVHLAHLVLACLGRLQLKQHHGLQIGGISGSCSTLPSPHFQVLNLLFFFRLWSSGENIKFRLTINNPAQLQIDDNPPHPPLPPKDHSLKNHSPNDILFWR